MYNTPRLMIAATGSGAGKTTLTCSLLKALTLRGLKAVSFKCGPDYIDPMFHKEVIGIPSRNLDLYMLGENHCNYLLDKNSEEADIAIIEGVMGFYDGIGSTFHGSSYELSQKTCTPVILVIDCKGMGFSVVPLIKGYLEFTDNNIKGVILNGVSTMMYAYYEKMIKEHLPIKVLGYLPELLECSLESRHLGLVTALEVKALEEKIEKLGEVAKDTLDIEGLIAIAKESKPLHYKAPHIISLGDEVRIGIAKDKAFSFYYEDNLELLEKLGAKLIPFSPLEDRHLPEHLDGLILGGGYPEVYAEKLSSNLSMKDCIRKALEGGMPCHAECGGFMYLQEKLHTLEGKSYEMVGYLSGEASMTKSLKRFGYIELCANEETPFMPKGSCIRAHEFHYSDSTDNGKSLTAAKPLSTKKWKCMVNKEHMLAGYPHLHYYSHLDFATRLVTKCIAFKKANR